MEKLKNQAREITNSPLGNLSQQYQVVESNKELHGLILDDTVRNELVLYPAGITKCDGTIPRQNIYESLYRWSEDSTKSPLTYPESFKIYLVPEPTNKYDKNAIRIQLVHPSKEMGVTITTNLGYIPAKLSAVVVQHLDMFTEPGRIVKVRNNYYDKFFAAKIALPYKVTNSFNKILLARFNDILEED
jgi:hypothetical protein